MHKTLVVIALILVGIVIAWLGYNERAVAIQSTQTPEEISLEKLLGRGPSGNPNIVLTGFVLCKNFVYQTDYAQWTRVWVPIVPGNAGDPKFATGRPAKVHALLISRNASNEAELYQHFARPKLRALVVNKLVSPSKEERELLQKHYPGSNFDRCLFIEEGREPAGQAEWMIMIGGGIAAILAGLLMAIVGIIRFVGRTRC